MIKVINIPRIIFNVIMRSEVNKVNIILNSVNYIKVNVRFNLNINKGDSVGCKQR